MENKETVEVAYSFDDLNILGVYGNNVYLKGTYDIEYDCVIKISRTLFKKSLDIWLHDKREYCELWGHFCGVMGSIRSLDYREIDKMEVYEQELNVYEINAIQEFSDMEHG
jgi:hypothetical protein